MRRFLRRKRLSWPRLALLVVGPVLALLVWTRQTFQEAGDVSVTSAAVTAGPIVRRVVVNGPVEPMMPVAVSAPIAGTVRDIAADVNTTVRAGQILLRLDSA